ncbi:hypothetical protein [Mucilaginibacter segetis]|uniref:Uncharacterized protein n=1 Tax=Mucilaginibacter segetis TaxID=2793071 RepID=A0A934UMI2_9SPHI|nr:hypothetical protein [Mucilaginibacter segetis]MBK0379060.1 hypothetical protein [Mucilaginibacter segetis]
MIKFIKNVKKVLPYDRDEYIDFFGDHFYSYTEWFGVSFQLPGGYEGGNISETEYLEAYETWFKTVISQFGNSSLWTVNHDKRDLEWFPNEEDNLTNLRTLFEQNNIPDKFKGALVFTTDDLLMFSADLITYPVAVFNKEGWLYSDLDISHNALPFIIKISAHCNIDLLSTDEDLLMEIVNKNSPDVFIRRGFGCLPRGEM